MPDDQLVEVLRGRPALVGSPEEVIAQVRALAAAGVGEIEMKWTDPNDNKGLVMLAQEVLPAVTPSDA